jgi:hypothetical protein
MRKRNGNLAFSVIEILDRGGETGRKRDRKRPWKGETKTKIFFVYLPLKWKFDICPFVTEGKKESTVIHLQMDQTDFKGSYLLP